jgi:hypothetical protein
MDVREATIALDLGFRSRLLPHEIIRRKSDYPEAAILETRGERLRVLVLGV